MFNQHFFMTPWINPWRKALNIVDNALISTSQMNSTQRIGPLFNIENGENFWILSFKQDIFIGREVYGLKMGNSGKNLGWQNISLVSTFKSQWVSEQFSLSNGESSFFSLKTFNKNLFAHKSNHWFSYRQKSTFEYTLLGHWSDADIVVG